MVYKKNIYYLTMSCFLIIISIILKILFGSINFGVINTAPEIFTLPIFMLGFLVNWKYSLIASIIVSIINFFFLSFNVVSNGNIFAILLDYFCPYIFMYLGSFCKYLWFKYNNLKNYILLSFFTFICVTMIYIAHSISGHFYYSWEQSPNSKLSPWEFTFIWNLPYCLLLWVISLVSLNLLIINFYKKENLRVIIN